MPDPQEVTQWSGSTSRRSKKVVTRAVIALCVLAVVAIPGLGFAGTVTGQASTYPVGAQSYNIARGPVSTSDTAFAPVPGLDLIKVGSRGPATASFSASLSGSPVEVRIVRDDRPLFPGPVQVEPAAGGEPFSYGFVAGRSVRARCHTFAVEWRSPMGTTTTMEDAALIVDFDGVRVTGGCAL